jgi:hypothetical protein
MTRVHHPLDTDGELLAITVIVLFALFAGLVLLL